MKLNAFGLCLLSFEGVGIIQSVEWSLICNTLIIPNLRSVHPLNLSILISGGQENNSDSLSNGE